MLVYYAEFPVFLNIPILIEFESLIKLYLVHVLIAENALCKYLVPTPKAAVPAYATSR